MRRELPRFRGVGRTRLLACIGGLAFWWGACWLAAGVYFAHRTDAAWHDEVAKAEQFVATTAEGFERIIAVRAGVPRLLARDAEVHRIFARIGPVAPAADLPYEERRRRWSEDPELAALNKRLAHDAADLRFGALGLFDTQGNTFVLGTAPGEKNWLGVNYVDRDYFPELMAGRAGYRVIFGKQFGVPGIAFFAPVVKDSRVIGAIISRVNLSPFLNWLAPADAFLTDRNGVVVLASDINIVGSSTADAPVHRLDAASRRVAYSHADLDLLEIASAGDVRYPELRRVVGREHPVIHRSQGTNGDDEPRIHVLWPFPQRAELAARGDVAALGAGAGGTVFLLLALALVARRDERKGHLAELAQREQAFRTLAESSPDFVIRYDTGQRIRYLNNKLLQFLELDSVDQVIGKQPIEVWPDGRFSAIQAAAADAIESAKETVVYVSKPAETGSIMRHSQIVVVPERDSGGGIIGAIAFGRDVTGLVNTEATLRKLNAKLAATLETIPDLLFEVDRDGRYIDVRAPDPALLVAPKEELLGHTFAEMLPSEAAQSAMKAIAEADSQGKSYGNIIRLDLPLGTRWFEVSAAKKQAGEESAASFVVLSRDITERMKALEEAQRLAQVRGEFLTHMSHELRTPLNSILGNVQLLQADSRGGARNAGALGAIREGGQRLMGMIDDILDLTRIEAGELAVYPEDVALAPCVREVTDIAATQARIKGVRLSCAMADDLPVSVHTDRERMCQVLTRLLANAVKFTACGEVELRVERQAERLCFVVRDSGAGIVPEHIEQLFQTFEPLGKVTSRPAGAGLGLALAGRLAWLLGGSLDVESMPGKGSTFRFALPSPDGGGKVEMQPLPVVAAPHEPTLDQVMDKIPPQSELRLLHALTLLGNMRDVRHEAARIATQTPAFRGFAEQIEVMAANFQSKALRSFIEVHLSAIDDTDSI